MRIDELLWDEWNISHIARHNVTPDEVEEIILAKIFVTRGRGRTYRVIAQTEAGRYLTVILSARGKNKYYVVTARDSDEAERRQYEAPRVDTRGIFSPASAERNPAEGRRFAFIHGLTSMVFCEGG